MENFSKLLNSIIEKLDSNPEHFDKRVYDHYEESKKFSLNEIVKPLIEGLGWEITESPRKSSPRKSKIFDMVFKFEELQLTVIYDHLVNIRRNLKFLGRETTNFNISKASYGLTLYQIAYGYSFSTKNAVISAMVQFKRQKANYGIITDGINWYIFTMVYSGMWNETDYNKTIVWILDLTYEDLETSIRKFSHINRNIK